MKPSEYFKDKELLNKQVKFYISKNQLIKIEENKELVKSYLEKAKHNLEF